MKIFTSIFLCFLFVGCTSAPLTVRPEGCRSQAFYSKSTSNNVRPVKEIESKYWSLFGSRDVTLLELLSQQDIKCEEVGAINYSVTQNASDVLLSILPGISRGTIKLQIQDAQVVEYFEPIRITQTPILMPRKDVAPVMRTAPPPTTFLTPKKGQLGVFYESLQGGFSQTDIASDAGADLEQGAPVAFGLNGSYELTSTVTFNSKLSMAKVSKADFGEFGEANLPFEINLRALIKHRQPGSLFRFGGGIDHERFSLFNNTELKAGADVEAYQSSVTFAVVELERFFELLDLPAQFSFLAGPAVMSSSTYSYLEGSSLGGVKFQFQFSFSPAPSWQTYFSYKLLQLSGETEVGIERLGLGLSYDFF